MLVGISLVGVITATVAAWFIDQTRDAEKAESADVAERLHKIEATLAEIHAALALSGGQEGLSRATNGEAAAPPARS
jgi:voltage-gated potassium channel